MTKPLPPVSEFYLLPENTLDYRPEYFYIGDSAKATTSPGEAILIFGNHIMQNPLTPLYSCIGFIAETENSQP